MKIMWPNSVTSILHSKSRKHCHKWKDLELPQFQALRYVPVPVELRSVKHHEKKKKTLNLLILAHPPKYQRIYRRKIFRQVHLIVKITKSEHTIQSSSDHSTLLMMSLPGINYTWLEPVWLSQWVDSLIFNVFDHIIHHIFW